MSPKLVAAIAAVSLFVPAAGFASAAVGVRAHSVTHPPQRVVDWSHPR